MPHDRISPDEIREYIESRGDLLQSMFENAAFYMKFEQFKWFIFLTEIAGLKAELFRILINLIPPFFRFPSQSLCKFCK